MIDVSASSPPTEIAPAPLVEVVAPDEFSAALLVEFVAPFFFAVVVDDTGFVVRLRPPAGPGAALKVRLLVESWLDAVPLPCATMIHADRRYVVRRRPPAYDHSPGGFDHTAA